MVSAVRFSKKAFKTSWLLSTVSSALLKISSFKDFNFFCLYLLLKTITSIFIQFAYCELKYCNSLVPICRFGSLVKRRLGVLAVVAV